MIDFKLIGSIDSKGRFYILNNLKFVEFCSKNKSSRIVLTFEVLSEEQSVYQKTYYKNYLLPRFQKMFYDTGEALTIDKVDEKVRSMSIFSIRESLGKGPELIPFEELNMQQLSGLIDDLKRIAAEEFNEYLE